MVQVGTSAKNPFAPMGLGPSIDNNLSITVTPDGGGMAVSGTLDGFPATEVYVTNEQGQTVAVVQFDPTTAGNSPTALVGGVGDQQVSVTCSGLATGSPSCSPPKK